MNNASKRLMK